MGAVCNCCGASDGYAGRGIAAVVAVGDDPSAFTAATLTVTGEQSAKPATTADPAAAGAFAVPVVAP